MRNGVATAALVLAVGVGPTRASADTLATTYGGDLVELSHRVNARLDGREVVFTVTRMIHNRGERAEELHLTLDVPTGAVATDLRTQIDGRWLRGELREANAAAALYDELTASGPLTSAGPALLSWGWGGELSLSMFPIMPESSVTLRYTLRAPTCYVDGHLIADYPLDVAGEVGLTTPLIRASDSAGGAARLIDAAAIERTLGINPLHVECEGVGIAPGRGGAAVTHIVYPAPIDVGVGLHYSRFDAGDGVHIARLELDAAPDLERMPKRARVVFVVDASHSQRTTDVAAQLDVVRAYMTHLPDAMFEIVVYRRTASRAFGKLVSGARAAEAIDALGASVFFGANGSHLDAGIAEAVAVLDGTDRPSRIIAFTDSRVRAALTPEYLATALVGAPDGVVLHLLDTSFSGGEASFERNDSHPFAPIVELTGGMLVTIAGGDGDPDTTAHAVLGLVVPRQIDDVAIDTVNGATAVFSIPDIVEHGDGYRELVVSDAAPDSITVRGKIWGREWTATATATGAGLDVAALVFGNEAWASLSTEQTARAANAAGVVSPVTSFLARDPDAPPTSPDFEYGSIGVPWGIGTSSVCGGVACGGVIGVGHAGTVVREAWDPERALAALLYDRVNGCALAHDIPVFAMNVRVEATDIEVVDVGIDDATDQTMAACVTEAAWELALDTRFVGDRTYTVRLAWPVD